MKRKPVWLLSALLLCLCFGTAVRADSAEAVDSIEIGQLDASENAQAEWTVLFYLCGSDLESRYSYATGNLEEISYSSYPMDALSPIIEYYGEGEGLGAISQSGQVNVVVETGGCREWHAQDLGMDISADRLQRWSFRPVDLMEYLAASLEDENAKPQAFTLEEELPLASMADPETLSDFILWGTNTYPAKKYALVLWDHGGGSKTGILIDELFDGDMLYLDELHEAMEQGGVTFEAVLFDACLMANLETAAAIADNARWMIASEEIVAGKGSAIDGWLQQLFTDPEYDGELLGRWICDMTQMRYGNEDDEQSQEILTWSVIDLSKIPRLLQAFDDFFAICDRAYETYPAVMRSFAALLQDSEEFGGGRDNMIDLADVFYGVEASMSIDTELRREMLEALSDAVTYSVRGSGRSAARGLSFCWASNLAPDELDIYQRNCPSAHYLALLDAINPDWTAPDRVYESADRLSDIREIGEYQIKLEKRTAEDGTPGVFLVGTHTNMEGLYGVYADLYRLDEATGQTVRMGSTVAFPDESMVYCIYEPWTWPAVEEISCDAELISLSLNNILINIPVQIDGNNWILRCGYDDETESYTIYGIWEGYDADSNLPNRNVKSLAQMAGQSFYLLYPVKDSEITGNTLYELSPELTMYRSLDIAEQPLPEGTYYLEYWVKDMFQRQLKIGTVEMQWDGAVPSFPDAESWEGTVTLVVPENQ